MPPEVVCPEDARPLSNAAGELVCSQGHRWKVRVGIPQMIPGDGNYTDAFGLQWNVYRKTQLDSYTGTRLSYDRARRSIGEECWKRLHQAPPAEVLEVGCGAGRFTEILLAAGSSVTSVDMSSAVEANQENFPQGERHRVFRADALRLPFAPGQFDLVFCLGVLQHTPDPEQTIGRLYEQVRPGGWLAIDHYTHNLSYYTKATAPLFRMVLRRLPPEKGLKVTERLVATFLPLHRAVRKSRVSQALLSRVSPILAYYHALPLSDDLQREWSLLDTHDSLTDWYKHFRTKRQIRRTLEHLGGEAIWSEYGGNGVEARCRRPVPG